MQTVEIDSKKPLNRRNRNRHPVGWSNCHAGSVDHPRINQSRWFDATTGRWISPDPTGFAAGDTNEYRYCDNSPTDATDPTGLRETDDRWTYKTRQLVDVSGILNTNINQVIAKLWQERAHALETDPQYRMTTAAASLVHAVYLAFGEDEPGSGVDTIHGSDAPIAKIGLLIDNNWLTAPNQIVKLTFNQSRYHNNSNPVGGLYPKNYWLWSEATRNHGLAPVIRIGGTPGTENGTLVGTDKFEHMFQQGYWLWNLAYGDAMAAIKKLHPGVAFPDFTQLAVRTAYSEWLEGTDVDRAGNVDPLVKQWFNAFGLITAYFHVKNQYGIFGRYSTGVISYADMAANEQGFQFYTALYNAFLSNPQSTPYTFDVTKLNLSSMNEQSNKNTFVNGITPDDSYLVTPPPPPPPPRMLTPLGEAVIGPAMRGIPPLPPGGF